MRGSFRCESGWSQTIQGGLTMGAECEKVASGLELEAQLVARNLMSGTKQSAKYFVLG